MKKQLFLLIMVIIAISINPFPSLSQNCNPKNQVSEKYYVAQNFMKTLTSADTLKNYTFPRRGPNKKIFITYGDSIRISLDYDPMSNAKIITYYGDILEVIILGTNGGSYLFIKGKDITKLVPELTGTFFRAKIDATGKIIILEVQNRDDSTTSYSSFNTVTGEYCPGKKIIKINL